MKTLIPFAIAYPNLASAAPLSFDCDVPPNHYSSVSQDVNGQMAISGTVKAIEMRSGKNLPVAGAGFVSADGVNGTGFQLVAASARANKFDILFNTNCGGDSKRKTVGQIGAREAITFSLSVSELGKVTLIIEGTSFNADFVPMSSGNEMVFCSTGQFKFSNLTFGVVGEPASPKTQ